MDHDASLTTIRLHYLDHPGGDPPLVLMHGLTSNAHAFDGLVKAGLSPAVRVLAPDLRGRGLSDKPDTGYGMAEHAADVLGLLDELGLRRVVLGGHSFGGFLALHMAAHYPGRVRKLVVIDAAGSMDPEARVMLEPALDRLRKEWPSWEAYLVAMKEMPFYEGWWDPTIESYYRADVEVRDDGTVKPRSRPEAIREAMEAVLAEDWPRHLAAIEQPLLLFNSLGAYGQLGKPILPRDKALQTVEAVPDGRYIEVPGNHMTMLYGEGAKRIVGEITTFVRS
ncbi:MAG: alpha/beta fold hydrolase [Gammaproteobacteria bacterium]